MIMCRSLTTVTPPAFAPLMSWLPVVLWAAGGALIGMLALRAPARPAAVA